MQFLWIGCLESDEEFEIKARKGYDLASAQVSQKNLLSGLEEVSGAVFDSINGSVPPPYPAYSDRIIHEVCWSHKKNAQDVTVGFRNLKYLNRICCKNAMIKAAKRWINKRYRGGPLVIFVYSMRSAPMATACYIKKHIKHSRIFLIVTDLPQFMDLGQNRIKAFLKKIDWLTIKRMQNEFDGFILYASKMADYLKIEPGKWLLMEGSYDVAEMTILNENVRKKAIMYSGKLDNQYGIPMLLSAFMSINDPEVELWLTGGGNAEEYINKCAEKDKRIKFFGFLPSRLDVLALQKKASLLVNMRLPSEPASAYCFPSKLFEYMATGIPVVSFKLAGIPREYYKYLCIVENETEAALCETIKKSLTSSNEKGIEAVKFIKTKKNKTEQCKRIYSFVGVEKEKTQ